MIVVAILALIVICIGLIGGGAKMGLLIFPAAAIVWLASNDKKGIDNFMAGVFGVIVIGGILAAVLAIFR